MILSGSLQLDDKKHGDRKKNDNKVAIAKRHTTTKLIVLTQKAKSLEALVLDFAPPELIGISLRLINLYDFDITTKYYQLIIIILDC